MLKISEKIIISSNEIEINAVRSQGAGGQNVNKVATAIHLRFDIKASSLPDFYQEKLLQLSDSRISKDGVIIIKAQQFRTQEQKLVKEEIDKIIPTLDAETAKKVNKVEVSTYVLNRLPPLYASSEEGLKASRKKVDHD